MPLFRKDRRLSPDASPYRAGASSALSISSLLRVSTYLLIAILLTNLFGGSSPAYAESDVWNACLSTIDTPSLVTAIHVQPDAGHLPILDEIEYAKCTIDISMYLFTDDLVVGALTSAAGRGVRVRVTLEKNPFGTFGDQQEMFDRLIEVGVDVQWASDQFTYSHAKYMVIDGSVAIITNQNFTGAGFKSNREFGVITTEVGCVVEAQAIFEADWNRSAIDFPINSLIVSPINSRESILDLINSSNESVWLYSEVLRDEEITTALSAAADRDVDVRILVNPSANEDDTPYFLDAMSHGVKVRVLKNPYVHSKAMIIDGSAVLIGSQNYSFTSLDLNREVGLIISDSDEIVKVVNVYERDWTRAEPVDGISIVYQGRANHRN